MNKNFKLAKGIITTYVLVFGTIFLLMLSGLLGFILLQNKQSQQKISWNQSLNIAEAGIEYYKWCLNNEIEQNCLVQKDYFDPNGNKIGNFSIEANLTLSCGQTIKREITSTGWTDKFPEMKRKIRVYYGRPSIAQYSYAINNNVWIGSDHEIRGPYHSNGGIRMDGENQSLVTSAKNEWICTSSFGCCQWVYFGAPFYKYGYDCSRNCPNSCRVETTGTEIINNIPVKDECWCPGVFTTANGNPNLFQFPVPAFDFVGITVDLAQMKTSAQSLGIYLPPSVDINSQGKGYHLIFKNNGDVDVRIITGLSPTNAYSIEEGWHYDYFTITSEVFYRTYTIPSGCPVIFIEDNLWPEGEIKGKITVASANLVNPNLDTDIVLSKNINYTASDGSDSLFLLGERNVLIGPQSLNNLELRGIFTAQKGRFSRNHYPNNIREKLEIYGSIISNGRVGTQWTSGSQIISGYRKRESYFDSNLIYNPSVFVPYVEPDFRIIKWEEL